MTILSPIIFGPPVSHHLHRTLRQGAEEGVAVVLGEDARVEDDDDAFVLLGAHFAGQMTGINCLPWRR